MPSQYVANLAQKKGVAVTVAEERWKKAKAIAEQNGHKNDYQYITGIFKKMMNENLQMTEAVDSSTWDAVRAVIRQVLREIPPDEETGLRDIASKWKELKAYTEQNVPKPDQDDILKTVEIIKQEMPGLHEAIVPLWHGVWFALQAAWVTFKTTIFLQMGPAASPVVIALFLGAAATFAAWASIATLKFIVVDFASWVYRKFKLSDLRITDLEVSPGAKMGVMLKHLEIGKTYTFDTQVSTQDAYHPLKAFVLLPANTPWVFRGFVQPRWMKEQYLLLAPLAGPMRGEERLVAVKVAEQVFFGPPGYVGESLQEGVLDEATEYTKAKKELRAKYAAVTDKIENDYEEAKARIKSELSSKYKVPRGRLGRIDKARGEFRQKMMSIREQAANALKTEKTTYRRQLAALRKKFGVTAKSAKSQVDKELRGHDELSKRHYQHGTPGTLIYNESSE